MLETSIGHETSPVQEERGCPCLLAYPAPAQTQANYLRQFAGQATQALPDFIEWPPQPQATHSPENRMTNGLPTSTPPTTGHQTLRMAWPTLPHRIWPIRFVAPIAISLALLSPASQAELSQPPKLSKSYFERVEELRDQVDDGKLSEVSGSIVSAGGAMTVPVDRMGAALTWWQYEDDTTFIHVKNDTGQTIMGLQLSFWIDSCAEKKRAPNIVYVLLKRPLRKNVQAVVKIPPSKSIHTTNEVSCLKISGAWSN